MRLARQDRIAQLEKHQTSKLLMVSCEFNSHWRQLYFLMKLLRHADAKFGQKCHICIIYENLELQYNPLLNDKITPNKKNIR